MRETPPRQPRNPLHSVTLEAMLSELVAHFGWAGLGERIAVNSFRTDPSIASSLKFLRRTPWAREKVESLYLFMRREQARAGAAAARAATPAAEPAAVAFRRWASPLSAAPTAAGDLRLGQLAGLGDE